MAEPQKYKDDSAFIANRTQVEFAKRRALEIRDRARQQSID